MVLLKKTLQVEERYPYPVRLEAMYEVIDQSPMRRLEKLRQKGFVQKCKGAGVEGQVEAGTLTGLFTSFTISLQDLFFSLMVSINFGCIFRNTTLKLFRHAVFKAMLVNALLYMVLTDIKFPMYKM